MEEDEELDIAAFGLPTGFGAKPKPKAAKASYDKTKRTERLNAADLPVREKHVE